MLESIVDDAAPMNSVRLGRGSGRRGCPAGEPTLKAGPTSAPSQAFLPHLFLPGANSTACVSLALLGSPRARVRCWSDRTTNLNAPSLHCCLCPAPQGFLTRGWQRNARDGGANEYLRPELQGVTGHDRLAYLNPQGQPHGPGGQGGWQGQGLGRGRGDLRQGEVYGDADGFGDGDDELMGIPYDQGTTPVMVRGREGGPGGRGGMVRALAEEQVGAGAGAERGLGAGAGGGLRSERRVGSRQAGRGWVRRG